MSIDFEVEKIIDEEQKDFEQTKIVIPEIKQDKTENEINYQKKKIAYYCQKISDFYNSRTDDVLDVVQQVLNMHWQKLRKLS